MFTQRTNDDQEEEANKAKALFPIVVELYTPAGCKQSSLSDLKFDAKTELPEKNVFVTSTSLFDVNWNDGRENMRLAVLDDVKLDGAVASAELPKLNDGKKHDNVGR